MMMIAKVVVVVVVQVTIKNRSKGKKQCLKRQTLEQ